MMMTYNSPGCLRLPWAMYRHWAFSQQESKTINDNDTINNYSELCTGPGPSARHNHKPFFLCYGTSKCQITEHLGGNGLTTTIKQNEEKEFSLFLLIAFSDLERLVDK